MRSLQVLTAFVDGNVQEHGFNSGKEFIHALIGDDFAAPPRYMRLLAVDTSGKQVSIAIPYDDSDAVRVI